MVTLALAAAVVRHAEAGGMSLSEPSAFRALAGHGVEASVDGRQILLGTARLLGERGVAIGELEERASALAGAGRTPVLVAIDGRPAGVLALADEAKPEAAAAGSEPSQEE